METYEDFIQRLSNSPADDEDEDDVQPLIKPSSVIVFHGLCALPPLLNEQQRAEMRLHRETAKSLKIRPEEMKIRPEEMKIRPEEMKIRPEEMKIRPEEMKTRPEEMKIRPEEMKIRPEEMKIRPEERKRSQKMSDISFTDESENVQRSICDIDHHMNQSDVTLSEWTHPLTSTAHDGQPANQLRAFPGDDSLENFQITVLFEGPKTHTSAELYTRDSHSDKHPQSDISRQMMMSSGYVTNENTDVTCDSSWIERQCGVENIRTAAGFHWNKTQSTSTGSDIISHAPVDGSALEEQSSAPEPAVGATEPVTLQSEADAAEEPYRMSLQNLLKKSQDYRRRQRLLRSQARALKPTEELSLSDKENQEFLPKRIWKTELRNARERRKVKMQPLDADISTRADATHADISTRAELRETCGDVSHTDAEISKETFCSSDNDTLTEETDALPQSTSTLLPVTAGSLSLSTQKPTSTSTSPPAGRKKFCSVPEPKFCLSPVHGKKGNGSAGPVRKAFCVEREADCAPITLGDRHSNVLRSFNDGGRLVDRSSEQTGQIAQLELNLSSLKALISDLESTLTLPQTETENSCYTGGKEGRSPDICLNWTSSKTSEVQQELNTKGFGIRQETPSQIRLSTSIRTIGGSKRPPHRVGLLTDSSDPSEVTTDSEEKQRSCGGWSSLIGSPLWQLYDGQVGVSRAKRRLLMNEVDVTRSGRDAERPNSSAPRALQTSAQEQEGQVRLLLEEERRQQQDLLQSLAVRYQFLRSVSFPCPSTHSRLEDTSTSSPPSSTHAVFTDAHNTSHQFSVSCRPLLAAVMKGFLTRRLLRTERVSRLITTIKDTRQFLLTFHQTPVRGEFSSRHDLMLQDRVSLQLRAARYQLHDIIFSSSCADRMKMIQEDRQLSRDRSFKQGKKTSECRVKASLSAATRKALERKKLVLLQRKSTDRTKFSPSGRDQWTFVPKICRVSKKETLCGGQ